MGEYEIGSALCIWLASAVALPRTDKWQYLLICALLCGSLLFQGLGACRD